MEDNSKVVWALLGGLALGAAFGILYAPVKGNETRDNLTNTLKNLGDSIKETAANEIDRLTNLKNDLVNDVKSKLKGTEQEVHDDLEHA